MTPAQALQRVIVRMLYDPTLVAQVYQGHTPPPLDATQTAMLRSQPRAAWETDPYRTSRTLQALIEEYPTAVALVGIAPLHRFFQDPCFHDAIMARAVLAVAFGDWLLPQAGAVAALEQAVVLLRRRRPVTLQRGMLRCATGRWPVSLPDQTLEAWQTLAQQLGPHPLERLLAPDHRPPPHSALRIPVAPPLNHWILEMDPSGQVQLSGGSAALNALLREAVTPIAHGALVEVAVTLGADNLAEATELIDELVEEGLLETG